MLSYPYNEKVFPYVTHKRRFFPYTNYTGSLRQLETRGENLRLSFV